MPVMDSKHGKLLIYGILFGCTDISVLLVSILGVGVLPFIGGFENREKIKNCYVNMKVVGIYLQYWKLSEITSKSKIRASKGNI